jgi:hypothetical protein
MPVNVIKSGTMVFEPKCCHDCPFHTSYKYVKVLKKDYCTINFSKNKKYCTLKALNQIIVKNIRK